MTSKYKYDVAISFAEEDCKIAEMISKAIENIGLNPYYYKNEEAVNWGENLFNIIIKRYKEEAQFTLVLISENYQKKKWANVERQIIQTVMQRENGCYVLPLAIDNTKIDGITNNILAVKWKENPNEIAVMIKEKLKNQPIEETSSSKESNPQGGITINNNEKVENQTIVETVIGDFKITNNN